MANREALQNDFSGGEVSLRMSMRSDTEVWHKAVKIMENFAPTLQGSAERVPGTQYVEEIVDKLAARIIPYLTPTNERSIVKITSDSIDILPDIASRFGENSIIPPDSAPGTVAIRRQIVENGRIGRGLEPWSINPPEYTSNKDGELMGLRWQGGFFVGPARLWDQAPNDIATCTIKNEATIPLDTAVLTVAFKLIYRGNTPVTGGYTCFVKLGRSDGASDLGLWDFKDYASEEVGGIADVILNTGTVNMLANDTVYLTVEWTAIATADEPASGPRFALDRYQVWANDEIEVGDGSVVGTVPYAAGELKDLHFIQSPLIAVVPEGVAKELVITHPNHPPYKLFYNTTTAQYEFNAIVFTNQPSSWRAGNYPATCGSFLGRLILAGSQGNPTLGDPVSGDTETVWGTEVGKWDTFSGATDVNPDDSIEFTTTYRSPIRWVYGQRDLLVGALEMEYIASADGIFSPGDLGVNMHSTHGSSNIQPAGFGGSVFFPAEGGTKVRSMSKAQDDEGWIARDMTITNPEICKSGIKRMVRMRNPHQMLVVLLNTGQLAVLHYDNFANISGWSRINVSGAVLDIAIMADEEGVDILFITVVRNIDGVRKLYIEAVANWVDNSENLGYLLSSVVEDFGGSQSFMEGLDHLDGESVQVTTDGGNYIGSYTVSAGRIDFIDELGDPVSYSSAHAGLTMPAELHTLPIVGTDPTSKKRYSRISMRLKSSIIPKIGVQSPDEVFGEDVTQRPPTRSTEENMGENSREVLLRNVTVRNLGWGTGQTVQIIEDIPQRVEILGVFGKLTSNSV
jgi:hypothetical protein